LSPSKLERKKTKQDQISEQIHVDDKPSSKIRAYSWSNSDKDLLFPKQPRLKSLLRMKWTPVKIVNLELNDEEGWESKLNEYEENNMPKRVWVLSSQQRSPMNHY